MCTDLVTHGAAAGTGQMEIKSAYLGFAKHASKLILVLIKMIYHWPGTMSFV